MGNADTLVIIFFVAILTSLATWVVPVGMFDSQEVQYQVDGQTKTRKVVDPHSFRILTNEAGEPEYHRVQLFTTAMTPGLMNFPFEGLTSGSKIRDSCWHHHVYAGDWRRVWHCDAYRNH